MFLVNCTARQYIIECLLHATATFRVCRRGCQHHWVGMTLKISLSLSSLLAAFIFLQIGQFLDGDIFVLTLLTILCYFPIIGAVYCDGKHKTSKDAKHKISKDAAGELKCLI